MRQRKTEQLWLGDGNYTTQENVRRVARRLFLRAATKIDAEGGEQVRALRRQWKTLERTSRLPARRFPPPLAALLNDDGDPGDADQARSDWWPIETFRDLEALSRRAQGADETVKAGQLAQRITAGLRILAERWHLPDTWLNPLLSWVASEFIDLEVPSLPLKPFNVTLTWNPCMQTRRGFKKDILELLQAYSDETAEVAGKANLVPVPPKREEAHFQWLARFQVKDELFDTIAGTCDGGVTADTVEVAVRRAARLVGLSLRSLPRTGRPRGRVEVRDRAPRQRQN